jgi:Cu(I)/Ag(I) efflux system membrane fusion protein
MSTRTQAIVSAAIVIAAAAVVAVYAMLGSGPAPSDGAMAGHDHAAMAGGGDAMRPVRIDPESARRIGITYATVEFGPLESTVRVLGLVAYDETRLVEVSPKIEGWAERLYVAFDGAPVRRGQPLLELYAPTLVAAQEELILARRLVDETTSADGPAAARARDLLDAARRRLAYWDIPAEVIAEVERSGTPRRTLPLLAPAGGVVVAKNVVEGARVMPETALYTIADLSRVWVEGEVFEKDLALVDVGRTARVSFDAYPGRTFEGTVSYVYPTISAETRTGRIRVELPNPELRLRPGMYANLSFSVPVHRDGLHVPRSAVLSTGTRSVVFVRGEDGVLTPREVTVGVAAGDHIEILAGLQAGEIVVASANFLIDAESNLGAAIDAMGGHGGAGSGDGHEDHGASHAPAPARPDHSGHPREEG